MHGSMNRRLLTIINVLEFVRLRTGTYNDHETTISGYICVVLALMTRHCTIIKRTFSIITSNTKFSAYV
jgi:hypothetical protein